MKLRFKVQRYQTDAVDAVVDCFAGQPRGEGVSHRIDPGRPANSARPALEFSDSGLRNSVADCIWPLVDALNLDTTPITDARKPKRIPLNEENFAKEEFGELWDRINHKVVYQVEFDSVELIDKCVTALDAQLNVAAMQYVVQSGQQRAALDTGELASGAGFTVNSTSTRTDPVSASSRVPDDLLGEITERTQFTRRTAAAILGRIRPTTFAQYRQNPGRFITECVRLINEQKAAVVVENLSYHTLAERYDFAIFTGSQTKQHFAKAGQKLS
ncbi:hypothetical protein [Salinispora vitiensis]|uniref:hypothetical protein n=1 Tax=Salinispora vitiensis TaxID=999544 RepID=UPI000370840B|nr:hypothetical protein [Salinispora vitiensis]